MTGYANLFQRHMKIDRTAGFIVGFFLVSQILAIALYQNVSLGPWEQLGGQSDPVFGGYIAAVVVIESLAIVAFMRYFELLPELVQRILKWLKSQVWNVAKGIAAIGCAWILTTPYWYASVALIGLYIAGKILDGSPYEWILHNIVVTMLAIFGMAYFAHFLTPEPVIVLLVLTIVWDYSAVSLSSIMKELVSFSTDSSIPNYYIIPEDWTVDTDEVEEWLSQDDIEEKPNGLASILGAGDIVFPSLLVLSTIIHGKGLNVAVAVSAGVLISVFALQAAHDRKGGALPGLPWLNTGAIAGYAIGILGAMAL